MSGTVASTTAPDPKLVWLSKATGVALKDKPVGKGHGEEPDIGDLEEKLREQIEKEFAEETLRKQMALAEAMRLLKPLKPAMKAGYDFQIVDKTGKSRDAQAKKGDLSKAGDVEDLPGGGRVQKQGVETTEIVNEATKAYQMLDAIQYQLETLTAARTISITEKAVFVLGKPQRLFTDGDIADEIFTPLVREKIMPPTLVEGKFSQVQKMLEGSMALYKEELKNAPKDENSRIGGILNLALTAGGAMVGAVLSVDGIDTKMVQDLLQGSTELAELTINFGDKARAGIDVQNVTDFLNGLPAIVGGMVGSAVGDSNLGEMITVGAGSATAAVKLIASSIQAKTLDANALILFGTSLIDIGMAKQNVDSDNDKQGAVFALGQEIANGLGEALGANAKTFIAAVQAGDVKAMRGSVMGSIKDFVLDGLPKILSETLALEIASSDELSNVAKTTKEENDIQRNDSGLTGEQQQEVNKDFAREKKEGNETQAIGIGGDTIKTVTETLIEQSDKKQETKTEAKKDKIEEQRKESEKQQNEQGEQRLAGVKSVLEEMHKDKGKPQPKHDAQYWEQKLLDLETKVDDEALKREQLQENPEEFAKSVRAELDKEREEFKKELEGLKDPSNIKSIQKLMAKIQRDRAIMSIAVAIGKGGFSVAAKFLAPMKIGTEAIKMSLNIKAVVERASNLRQFVDEAAGARNAVSPYLSSIQNFVDNQQNQLDQYSIRIAFNAANLVAAAAATAFPLAAPAVAIVDAGQSAAELIFAVENEVRLRKAWALTKEVLANPGNRRLGLRVRKFNPTLAKYTVAYGAKVEGDPIAISMCNACGIDNDSLKKEDEGAKKVKAFLELKFDEDGKLAVKYEDPPTWVDDLPDPQFTPGCVFHTYKLIAGAFEKDEKAKKIGGISPQPSELATLMKAAAQEPGAKAASDELRGQVLLLERVAGAFRLEADRLSPLGVEASNAILPFAELAETGQNKLVMRLLKQLQTELKN